jgi:hypothetical protein
MLSRGVRRFRPMVHAEPGCDPATAIHRCRSNGSRSRHIPHDRSIGSRAEIQPRSRTTFRSRRDGPPGSRRGTKDAQPVSSPGGRRRSPGDDENLSPARPSRHERLSRRQGWRETQACSKWSETDLNSFTNQSTPRCVLPDSQIPLPIQNTFRLHQRASRGARFVAVHRPPRRIAAPAPNSVRRPILVRLFAGSDPAPMNNNEWSYYSTKYGRPCNARCQSARRRPHFGGNRRSGTTTPGGAG